MIVCEPGMGTERLGCIGNSMPENMRPGGQRAA
jgi:hypothetical protein